MKWIINYAKMFKQKTHASKDAAEMATRSDGSFNTFQRSAEVLKELSVQARTLNSLIGQFHIE